MHKKSTTPRRQWLKTALYDFGDLTKLMGFEDVWAFEKRYAED